MKKYSVISSNYNIDYIFLLPIVSKFWQLIGYCPIIILINVPEKYRDLIAKYLQNCRIVSFPGFKDIIDSTVSQCIRLFSTYLHFINDEDILITGDADMIVAFDFFKEEGAIVSYGADLCDYKELPICYIKATAKNWAILIGDGERNKQIYHEMKTQLPESFKSNVWLEYWTTDQKYITQRAKEYGYDKINFINRGTDPNNSNLPLGRCDRYNNMKLPQGPIHDVHLMRDPTKPENVAKIIEIASLLYPNEYWGWINEYRDEFVNSLNQ